MSDILEHFEDRLRQVLLDIGDIAFPVFFFHFRVPVFYMLTVRYDRIRHVVVIAGLKGAPDRFGAHMLQDLHDVLQIFLGILIC